MARERGERLLQQFDEAEIACGRAFLRHPGISVLREATVACSAGQIHAMHDPTEGGVATGLWELGEAGACGLLVDADAIPVVEPGGAFCHELGLDPLGTIASGSLIICTPPSDAEAVRDAVADTGISCVDIGHVTQRAEGVMMVRDGTAQPVPTFPQDEITKLFT
jgi:hydrogenase maturation factor